MVVHVREVFHSALFLALMFTGVAGIFLILDAEFLAVIQLLIYAGAVVVIVLFAIMLTKRERGSDVLGPDLNVFKAISVLGFGAVMVGIFLAGRFTFGNSDLYGSPQLIARVIFERYMVHFELIAILLLGALIVAVFLARGEEYES
jgi:NADH-quinone oxidoreductase subunit J